MELIRFRFPFHSALDQSGLDQSAGGSIWLDGLVGRSSNNRQQFNERLNIFRMERRTNSFMRMSVSIGHAIHLESGRSERGVSGQTDRRMN